MKFYRWSIAVSWLTSATALAEPPKQALYLDPELADQRRAADLIARMTLEEKALQMQSTAPAAQR